MFANKFPKRKCSEEISSTLLNRAWEFPAPADVKRETSEGWSNVQSIITLHSNINVTQPELNASTLRIVFTFRYYTILKVLSCLTVARLKVEEGPFSLNQIFQSINYSCDIMGKRNGISYSFCCTSHEFQRRS